MRQIGSVKHSGDGGVRGHDVPGWDGGLCVLHNQGLRPIPSRLYLQYKPGKM